MVVVVVVVVGVVVFVASGDVRRLGLGPCSLRLKVLRRTAAAGFYVILGVWCRGTVQKRARG